MLSLFSTPALKIRDFRLLLINKFLLTFGSQMITVIVGWQVYQLTKDPLSLGLIGLSEAIAFTGFALWAGHVADQSEKRLVIWISEIVILLCFIALWLLTLTQNLHTLPIYLIIGVSGVARAFLWSSSTSFSELLVPKEIYSSAAAWNSSVWEVASILGPAAGGVLYGWVGVEAAYAVALTFSALALYSAVGLQKLQPIKTALKEKLWQSLSSGLRFVFGHRVILGAIGLDMFAVLFGGVVAVLPIFAEILHVGPTGLGFLRASQSVGAIIVAIAMTRRPPFKEAGKTLLTCVALFGVCIIAFALSRNIYLSMLLLALAGAVDNFSVIIRASIMQAATPDAMRGRVAAVNGIFIGSSNELGAFESGLAARLMGTIPSVLFGGMMTLVTVAVVAWRFPQLRKLKRPTDLDPGLEGFNKEIERL